MRIIATISAIVILIALFSVAWLRADTPEQGTPSTRNWAYIAPVRPALPAVVDAPWCRVPLDAFVLTKLERAGRNPSREASREQLIRRVTFDLTGLPPTIEEIDCFLNDDAPDAYERLVERLLASPRFGERMATPWLDAARYADTHGYHADSHRDMWAWRDWVVAALNANMPFDQFTIEQLAGDLLPDATPSQRLATGLHRNTLINAEPGAIAAEYLAEYVADRVITTSTIWLGQTMQCARCHDHPYDPFTQQDFYRLFALFHNVPEQGLDGRTGNAAPVMRVPTAEQERQLAAFEAERQQLRQQMEKRRSAAAKDLEKQWLKQLAAQRNNIAPPQGAAIAINFDQRDGQNVLDDQDRARGTLEGRATWITAGKFGGALLLDGATHVTLTDFVPLDRQDPFSAAMWVFPTTRDDMTLLAQRGDDRNSRGWQWMLHRGKPAVLMTHDALANTLLVQATAALETRQWQHLVITYDGSSSAAGIAMYVNGQRMDVGIIEDTLSGSISAAQPLRIGRRQENGFRGMVDELRVFRRCLSDEEAARLAGADPVAAVLALDPQQRSPQQKELLLEAYLEHFDPEYFEAQARLRHLDIQQRQLQRSVSTVMVMEELDPPRATYVLERGDYQQLGQRVVPGVPEAIAPWAADLPANRYGLARWLTDPQHPLVARVTVNRYWQLLMGRGLVATAEDFGTQGQLPSHPELLDWLAIEFIESGWDTKHLLRCIVHSATYRQSSHAGVDAYREDPENRLLGRGPRGRLPVEMIRDAALHVSGLLVERRGGPGVFPYQPAGLWEEIAYNPEDYTAQVYVQSDGADLYRRTLYTFWKRTRPPPALEAFDAPSRETCVVRRSHTNTAQQALVLMNDPTYVEAARALAQCVLSAESPGPDARLALAFRRVLGRMPSDYELSVLCRSHARLREIYCGNQAASSAVIRVGESRPDDKWPADELAAWTATCSLLLGLDEAISKP